MERGIPLGRCCEKPQMQGKKGQVEMEITRRPRERGGGPCRCAFKGDAERGRASTGMKKSQQQLWVLWITLWFGFARKTLIRAYCRELERAEK